MYQVIDTRDHLDEFGNLDAVITQAKGVTALKGLSEAETAARTTDNARRLFGIIR